MARAWTSEALTENYSQLIATSTIVYLFSSSDETLSVVNIADGMLAWTYNAPSADYDLPIVTDDAVYLFNESTDNL